MTVDSYLCKINMIDDVINKCKKCVSETNEELKEQNKVVIDYSILNDLVRYTDNFKETILNTKVEEVK